MPVMQFRHLILLLALLPLCVPKAAPAPTLPERPRHMASAPGPMTGIDPAAMPTDPDPPPTRDARDGMAASDSLLGRQSEIAASILLLERQLRQAELVGKLMAIYGPETMIEVLPGAFRSFADTPAGERVAAELEIQRFQHRINRLRLEAEIRAAEGQGGGLVLPLAGMATAAGGTGAPADLRPVLQVHEISGVDGAYEARVALGERLQILRPGDVVEGLGTVTGIDRDGVVVEGGDGEVRYGLGH